MITSLSKLQSMLYLDYVQEGSRGCVYMSLSVLVLHYDLKLRPILISADFYTCICIITRINNLISFE